jgi:hypothetical protein
VISHTPNNAEKFPRVDKTVDKTRTPQRVSDDPLRIARIVLMYLGRRLDTSDAQKRAWRVYRTARTAFPFLSRSVTCSFQTFEQCERVLHLCFVGVVFLHPTTTRRQAGCFMLLIVSLSNGLNRNPQPLSARRISITQGTGSVWLTSV